MTALVIWSLLRLHARPRAGWTMLCLVFLWGVINFGMSSLIMFLNSSGVMPGLANMTSIFLLWSCLHSLLMLCLWGWIGYEFWRPDADNPADITLDPSGA